MLGAHKQAKGEKAGEWSRGEDAMQEKGNSNHGEGAAKGESDQEGKGKGKGPERGGPKGPEPTRYGDWERQGRVSDF